MHLVYRAMEKEPVPTSLPNSLIPPSKRKKTAGALPGAVAVLPSVPGLMAGQGSLKDTLRSTPPLNNAPLLSTSAVSMSPKHSFRSSSAVCYCTFSSIISYSCVINVLYCCTLRNLVAQSVGNWAEKRGGSHFEPQGRQNMEGVVGGGARTPSQHC